MYNSFKTDLRHSKVCKFEYVLNDQRNNGLIAYIKIICVILNIRVTSSILEYYPSSDETLAGITNFQYFVKTNQTHSDIQSQTAQCLQAIISTILIRGNYTQNTTSSIDNNFISERFLIFKQPEGLLMIKYIQQHHLQKFVP